MSEKENHYHERKFKSTYDQRKPESKRKHSHCIKRDGEYFQRTLLELYNSLIRTDTKKYGYILESGQLHPKIVKEMIDFDNTIVLCLGLGELTPEDIVTQCVTYDTEESWTYGLSEEYLLEHAQDWYNCNEMLKIECPKYGINYIDTSKDRERVLSQILENLFK